MYYDLAGVHVAVVDCGAYPDVCNIFNVSTFPSIKTKLVQQ